MIIGLIWCKQIFARLGSDLEELCEPAIDSSARTVIAMLCLEALIVGYWEISCIAGLAWSGSSAEAIRLESGGADRGWEPGFRQ